MPKAGRSATRMLGVVLLCGLMVQGCGSEDDNSPDPSTTAGTPDAAELSTSATPNTTESESVVQTETAQLPGPASSETTAVELEPGENMTYDQMMARSEMLLEEYTWPPSYVPDFERQYANVIPEVKEGSFQQGYEYTLLNGWHACAWTLAWAEARQAGDAAAEAQALDVMTNILPDHPGSVDPSTIQWMTDMAAKAALGDPTMVNQYISANRCHDLAWVAQP